MTRMVSQKAIMTKFILMSLDIKQIVIANELNLSQGQISKIIAGEQNNPDFNNWIINKLKNEIYCN